MDTDEASIGTSLLQKYRDGDSISNFFRSLTFNFSDALMDDCPKPNSNPTPHSETKRFASLSTRRVLYHRMTESMRNQILWIAIKLQKLHKQIELTKASSLKKFRMGILLSDVLPETGEFYCKVIVASLLKATCPLTKVPYFAPNEITIFGRRDALQSWMDREHCGVETVWDWENNTQSTDSVSLIIMLSSSMHVTLIEEQLRGHDLSETVLVSTVPALTHARVSTLLRSKLTLPLFWNFNEHHAGDGEDQNITWASDKVAKGACLPDLDLFKSVCSELCRAHGLTEEQVKQSTLQALPRSTVAALEEFQTFGIGRYSLEQELASEIESDFRRRLIAGCHSKCISPAYLQDGELNKGEAVCLDRCVYKFMHTNGLVQKVANEVGSRMMGSMGMEDANQPQQQ
ncbi:hypothetical protein CcCBS67573_g05943 [Chytriomyces confervae]|uniref:Mitochondrial import inner membrane translocase subunit TIM10 n=1 Tax=Chytriomyces confervae TaxID=246404 RepID=A0A507F6Y2_9FUNG|nr:hypothetical protein CcCBS67573_g05943 [Chytriomyces confervae]